MKQPVHFAPNQLLSPAHPLIVNLIGAGGTGSQMLTALVKINQSLMAFGHPGLMVNLFDSDIITSANKGRLLFTKQDIGLPKSVVFINRVNRLTGTNWKAITADYSAANLNGTHRAEAEITISCVDHAATRFEIADVLKDAHRNCHYPRHVFYWMDCGNSKDTGQVLLSTVYKIKQPDSKKFNPVASLPMITNEYRDLLLKEDDGDRQPSCSVADALNKQNLFINPMIAGMGASILWDLLRDGFIVNRGFFLNLKNLQANPIPVQRDVMMITAAA